MLLHSIHYDSYGKYCHWPKLCIDDDASVYILVFNLLLSNIHVRQPFPASLAGKKSWKKKIGPSEIRTGARISHCLADSELNY